VLDCVPEHTEACPLALDGDNNNNNPALREAEPASGMS